MYLGKRNHQQTVQTVKSKQSNNTLCIKVTCMSSIKNRGENEFADDESNIVGKSEESEDEQDQKILKTINKEISNEEDKEN